MSSHVPGLEHPAKGSFVWVNETAAERKTGDADYCDNLKRPISHFGGCVVTSKNDTYLNLLDCAG